MRNRKLPGHRQRATGNSKTKAKTYRCPTLRPLIRMVVKNIFLETLRVVVTLLQPAPIAGFRDVNHIFTAKDAKFAKDHSKPYR